MGVMNLVIVLVIVGWVYERARKRKRYWLAKIMIGIASFVIAANVATLLASLAMLVLPPDSDTYAFIRFVLAIGITWVTYVLIRNKALPSTSQEPESTSLDAGLIDTTKQGDQDQN